MHPWFAKAAFLVALFGFGFIRAPHGRRSRTVRIAEDRRGALDTGLLIGAGLGTTLIPLIWVITGFPARADYPLYPLPYWLGVVVVLPGLWLFHRSHTDLGTNWSVTLQTRETHRLITGGVYRRIRHPMYAAMFVMGIAHALFIPNWIVGPAYFVTLGTLYLFRVRREERMMLDRFGAEYEAYMRRSGRLIPRLGARATD